MADNNLKWYFPQSKNVSGRGENDPQKELFPGDVYQTLIRESIQNSLDHPSSTPVRVEYKLKRYEISNFPYFTYDLLRHIQSCYDISKADKFKRMLDVLSFNSFYMLEVADYNTIGMDYDYYSDKGRFKKFVRYTGDPNEISGSGGSHGYGKIAYFSVSEINTIIVSSKTMDETCTFEGTSRLATHPTGEPRCSFYDTGFLDLGDGAPIQIFRGRDKSIIPEIFRREQFGTTVFIPFVNISDETRSKSNVFKTCCEAVLRNFFASINDGNLEVLIDFSEGELYGDDYIFNCNQNNIEDIFNNRFFNNPPYDNVGQKFFDRFNPHPYWLAYRNNEVTVTEDLPHEEALELCAGKKYIRFNRDLPILGSSSFFVNVDSQRGNNLILFMRVPRMVVGVNHKTSGSGFSAVFLCDDSRKGKGNELLRIMEDAAHRTWSKKQLEIDKRPREMFIQAGRIETEMQEFINDCLSIVFPASQTDSVDVELDDFTMPMISESDTTNPLIGSLINKQGTNDQDLGGPVDIHVNKSHFLKKSQTLGKAIVVGPKRVKKTEEETDITGGRKGDQPVNPRPHPHHPYNGDDNYTEDDEREERLVRMKFPVKYRIFSDETEDGQILYTLIVHSPKEEEKAYITLTPVGETDDKSCNVHLKTVSEGQIRGNEIIDVPLKMGKNVITFSVDNNGEYAFTLFAEHDVSIKE